MKTKKDRLAKRIVIGALTFLLLLFLIPFGFGFYQGVKMHTGISEEIQQTLKEHCHCDEVRQGIASYGLQFSKEGLSNETLNYYIHVEDLTKASNEAMRLNTILIDNVDDYEETDLIRLVFETEEDFEEIIIKNGKIEQDEI